MTPALLNRLTAHMLEMAADKFSNNSCTYFDATKELNLTKDEEREFIAWLRSDEYLDEESRKRIKSTFTDDWVVMLLLARHYGDLIRKAETAGLSVVVTELGGVK